jgi:hypothetical protein
MRPTRPLLCENFDVLSRMPSVKAMRFAEHGKPIKFKIRFKAVPEEVKPTILCRICELFTVRRALMLESEPVLEVMHHFVHQDG